MLKNSIFGGLPINFLTLIKIELFNNTTNQHTLFEQTFKNIDDILYKDAGADSELDYIGQTSWVLFLRYLDQLEKERKDEAELEGKDYTYILDEEYRWSIWAMPKNGKGEPHSHAMTGPDLLNL